MEEKIIEISKITHDEELEKILQKYPLEEGYDITVVPIDATREKIIIKKVQKEEKASLTKQTCFLYRIFEIFVIIVIMQLESNLCRQKIGE